MKTTGKVNLQHNILLLLVDNMELKLFNIAKDPGERIDLAAQNPEKVKELEAAYKNWIELNVRK